MRISSKEIEGKVSALENITFFGLHHVSGTNIDSQAGPGTITDEGKK